MEQNEIAAIAKSAIKTEKAIISQGTVSLTRRCVVSEGSIHNAFWLHCGPDHQTLFSRPLLGGRPCTP